jgi:hypothetical protein
MPEAVKGPEANTKVPAKKKQQQMIWWIAGGAGLVLLLVIWFTNRSASNAASGAETASTEGGTGIAGTLAALESAGVLGGSAAGGAVGVTGPAGTAGAVGATGPRGATGPSGATGKSGGLAWTKAQEQKAWGSKRSKNELGKLFIGGKWYSGVPKPALSSSPYASGGTYTVRPGDSIQGIANRFRIPGGWENLYKINQGTIGAHPVIYPGMRLKI